MSNSEKKIILVRHGETPWTITRQHTGLTDLPLTQKGMTDCLFIKKALLPYAPQHIFTSPLTRAKVTCENSLPTSSDSFSIMEELKEWDYGRYEGLTNAQIQNIETGWSIFTHGAPEGESLIDIDKRTSLVLKRLEQYEKNIVIFSHGHFLRALAAKWLDLTVKQGELFLLFPSSISVLGYERTKKVIVKWNDTSHLV